MELVLSAKNNNVSSNQHGLQDYFAFMSNEYAYQGEAHFDATDDYRYLIIKYTGDIASIRLEFADSGKFVWFSDNEAGSFITTDGEPIPFYDPDTDDGVDKVAYIDLEASGVSGSEFSHFHIHSGYGGGSTSTMACIFKSAYLTDKLPEDGVVHFSDLDFISELIRDKSVVYLRREDYPNGAYVDKFEVGKIYTPIDYNTKSSGYSSKDSAPTMYISLGSAMMNLSQGTYIPLLKYGRVSMTVLFIGLSSISIQFYTWNSYSQTIINNEYKMLTNSDVLTKYNTTSFTPYSDYNPATKKYVDDTANNTLQKNNTTSYTPTGDYNPATKKYVDDSKFFVTYVATSKPIINPGLLYIHLTSDSVFRQVLNYPSGFYWMGYGNPDVSTPVKIIVGDVDVTNRKVINGFIIGRFVYGGTAYTGINFVDFGNIIPDDLFITPITNMNIFKDETTGNYYQSYVDNGELKIRQVT